MTINIIILMTIIIMIIIIMMIIIIIILKIAIIIIIMMIIIILIITTIIIIIIITIIMITNFTCVRKYVYIHRKCKGSKKAILSNPCQLRIYNIFLLQSINYFTQTPSLLTL